MVDKLAVAADFLPPAPQPPLFSPPRLLGLLGDIAFVAPPPPPLARAGLLQGVFVDDFEGGARQHRLLRLVRALQAGSSYFVQGGLAAYATPLY